MTDFDALKQPLVELAQELRSIDVSLRDQNRASRRRIWWGSLAAAVAVVAVLLVGAGMWAGLENLRSQNRTTQQNQAEIRQLGEVQITEALRRERDVLLHRERKEECLIRPFNEVIEHRINARNAEVHIELCDPDKTLDEISDRLDALKVRIAEREALGYG